jgi:hypothetical protein
LEFRYRHCILFSVVPTGVCVGAGAKDQAAGGSPRAHARQ